MKCGKMGQQGWGRGGKGGVGGGRSTGTVGRWIEGGWESLQWENSILLKTLCNKDILKLEKFLFLFFDCSSQQTGSAAGLILQIKSYNFLHVFL